MSGGGHGGAYMFSTLGPSKLTCDLSPQQSVLLMRYSTTTGRPSLGQPGKGITVHVPEVSTDRNGYELRDNS
jgi:hypothetical protein